MVQLILLLLGADYIRGRAKYIRLIGTFWVIAGCVIFFDALDDAIYFPIQFFAWLFFIEGIATLAVAWAAMGGQRILRYVKGGTVVLVSILIFSGAHNGNFLLSMFFGILFLIDGLLQCISASLVRYRRWKIALAWGILEILIAIFFFQPYPTNYIGTLPYGLGVFLIFGGIHLITLASRVQRLSKTPKLNEPKDIDLEVGSFEDEVSPPPVFKPTEWDGPPSDDDSTLIVHVWTPAGSSKAAVRRHPIFDRYIAAVDINGVISTGHAAMESPEGIYISLYPGVEIDRSPGEFGRILRATHENDVPGIFQPDYSTESKAWCPSTVQVRIRNYDPSKLRAFWEKYRANTTYNLTHRNCSSSVSNALEAAIDGAVGRLHGGKIKWTSTLRILVTPELWVAAQIRKRAVTMAWTPGLTLDYARALSMLVDPRPFAWLKVSRDAIRIMSIKRKEWRNQDSKQILNKK